MYKRTYLDTTDTSSCFNSIKPHPLITIFSTDTTPSNTADIEHNNYKNNH